jgi:hypothetical protein
MTNLAASGNAPTGTLGTAAFDADAIIAEFEGRVCLDDLITFEDAGVARRQAEINIFVNEILMLSIIHSML